MQAGRTGKTLVLLRAKVLLSGERVSSELYFWESYSDLLILIDRLWQWTQSASNDWLDGTGASLCEGPQDAYAMGSWIFRLYNSIEVG